MGGSMVNVSSVAGLQAAPESAAYCVAKAGVVMMTKQAALDWALRYASTPCVRDGCERRWPIRRWTSWAR